MMRWSTTRVSIIILALLHGGSAMAQSGSTDVGGPGTTPGRDETVAEYSQIFAKCQEVVQRILAASPATAVTTSYYNSEFWGRIVRVTLGYNNNQDRGTLVCWENDDGRGGIRIE
jgi:hypothetical protein